VLPSAQVKTAPVASNLTTCPGLAEAAGGPTSTAPNASISAMSAAGR
jgi:hypothetical protein